MDDRLPGDPTQEEIRRECEKIKAGWTISDEYYRRTGIPYADEIYIPPQYSLSQMRSK